MISTFMVLMSAKNVAILADVEKAPVLLLLHAWTTGWLSV